MPDHQKAERSRNMMLANKSFENAPRNRLQVNGSDVYKLFHVHD